MKFTLDFLAKTAGLKNSAELLEQIGDEFDDTVDGGKKLAAAMRVTADRIETDLEQTRKIAERLGNSLGPELSQKMGQARLDDWAVKIRQAGVSADDLDGSIDDITDSIKRMDAASDSLDTFDTKMRQVGDSTERTGSVTANYLGNAAQEIPGVTGAFGPLNMAIGQFVEYAAEGGISFGKFVKAGVGIAGVSVALGLLNAAMESNAEKQRRMEQRAEEVGDALEEQTRKAYELAAANAAAGGSLDGLALASRALNQAIVLTGANGEKLTESLGALGMSADDGLASVARMRSETSEFIEELVRGTGAFKGYEAQVAGIIARSDEWGNLVDSLGWEAANENIPKVTEAQLELIKAIEGVQDAAEETDLQASTKQFLDNAVAASEAGRELVLLAEKNTGVSRSVDGLLIYNEFNRLLADSDALTRDAILGTDEYGTSLGQARSAIADFKSAMDAANEAVREQSEALADAIDGTYDYEKASLDLADSVAGLAEKQAETNAILNDGTKSDAEKAAALRDLRRAEISSAEGALEAARAYAVEQGAVEGSPAFYAAQRDALEQMKAKYPELTGAIDAYIAKLNAIPAVKNTTISASFSGSSGSSGGSKSTPGPMKLEGLDGPSRSAATFNVSVNVNGVITGSQVGREIADALTRWFADGGTAGWVG